MGKRELIALLNLSSWCLVMVERFFLAVPRGCLQFVNVVFPNHTHLLFLTNASLKMRLRYQRYLLYSVGALKGIFDLPYCQNKHYISNLRRFQSLPIRTATCVVYMLIGALPLEAELHKCRLNLLYNILICTNKTIRELSSRQIAFNLCNNQSYFSKVQDILNIYDLPNLRCLSKSLTSKDNWKFKLKEL